MVQTPTVAAMATTQETLDRAYALAAHARAAAASAVANRAEPDGVDLVLVQDPASMACSHLAAAGAVPPLEGTAMPVGLSVREAARRAHDALVEASGLFVSGGISDDELDAVSEMWAGAHAAQVWL